MKHAENIDVAYVFYEVGDPIVSIEQNTNVARRRDITVTNFGNRRENLCSFKNTVNRTCGDAGTVCRNVLKDVFKLALSLCSPRYCCHERMRRAISSFEITRLAAESASPRSTIA